MINALTMLVLGAGYWLYLNLKQLYKYINDNSTATGSKPIITWDASRCMSIGAGLSETGEVVYRLLTAKRSERPGRWWLRGAPPRL
jgi:hypothetical protein